MQESQSSSFPAREMNLNCTFAERIASQLPVVALLLADVTCGAHRVCCFAQLVHDVAVSAVAVLVRILLFRVPVFSFLVVYSIIYALVCTNPRAFPKM